MGKTYVVLELRNLRALVRVVCEGVAKLEGERLLGERVEELVVDALLDEDTGAGAASLTVIPADESSGWAELWKAPLLTRYRGQPS